MKEGDTIVRFVSKTGSCFNMEIRTYDGAIIYIAHNSYTSFITARKAFERFIEENQILKLSPYIAPDKPIEVIYCGIKIKTIPNILKIIVKNTIKMKRLCEEKGDMFLGYTSSNITSFSMKILLEKKEVFELNNNIYNQFVTGRDIFYKRLKEDKVKSLSLYKGNKEKILLDFDCGHKPHWIRPNDYNNGRGCPLCILSKGEKIIMKYLDEIGEEYIHQYNIVSHNERLSRTRYDIFMPRLNMVVEVNGLQHYEIDGYYTKTQEDLDKIILNDTNKYYYALENVFEYMEVDYREGKPQLALERFKTQFKKYIK